MRKLVSRHVATPFILALENIRRSAKIRSSRQSRRPPAVSGGSTESAGITEMEQSRRSSTSKRQMLDRSGVCGRDQHRTEPASGKRRCPAVKERHLHQTTVHRDVPHGGHTLSATSSFVSSRQLDAWTKPVLGPRGSSTPTLVWSGSPSRVRRRVVRGVVEVVGHRALEIVPNSRFGPPAATRASIATRSRPQRIITFSPGSSTQQSRQLFLRLLDGDLLVFNPDGSASLPRVGMGRRGCGRRLPAPRVARRDPRG